MNILTLIILGFLILGGFIGYHKVFARSVLNVIIAVFALSVSFYVSPFLSNELGGSITLDEVMIEKISAVILEDMQTKVAVDYARHNGLLYSDVSQELTNQLVSETFHVDPSVTARLNILQYIGFPKSVTAKMTEVIKEYDDIYIDSSYAPEYIAIFLVQRAMEIGTFIIIAWLIYHGMGFGIDYMDKKKDSEVKFVGTVSKIGGAVLGCFTVMVVVWALFVLMENIRFGGINDFVMDQVYTSRILTAIHNHNLIHLHHRLDFLCYTFPMYLLRFRIP